jgi:ubiquinone/menaquinone biosynthesis C-methylase UbiE
MLSRHTARVLECRSAAETEAILIAQAYLMPDARFVGVDLSRVHIDDANKAAVELGLKNIEFRQMDVAEMSVGDFGEFDYITAHGLFSWVPEFVRERVLVLYAELLNPNGVGYISYGVYPGAHLRRAAQGAMRFASRDIAEPEAKVSRGLSFLKFLTENSADKSTYRRSLVDELGRHRSHTASDIFHDDLSELNTPFYFHEFVQMLSAHGLQFLAEAELHAMGAGDLPAQARDFISSLDDAIEREQYLDLLRGRSFRQTLFCRSEIELSRIPAPEVLNKLRISSALRPKREWPEIGSERVEKFVGTGGVGIEIDRPLVKAMLVHLSQVWPRSVAFPELVEEGTRVLAASGYELADAAKDEEIARVVFLQIARASRMVELHTFQADRAAEPGDMPRLNPLARLQMRSAEHIATGLGIDMKIEDEVSRRLLELFDGTRSRDVLHEEMKNFVRDSPKLPGRDKLLKGMDEWVEDSIRDLARIGAFVDA